MGKRIKFNNRMYSKNFGKRLFSALILLLFDHTKVFLFAVEQIYKDKDQQLPSKLFLQMDNCSYNIIY